MSNVPQPGWWQAADGLWYPPQPSPPGQYVQPGTYPQPQGPPKSKSRLKPWKIGLIAVVVLVIAIVAASGGQKPKATTASTTTTTTSVATTTSTISANAEAVLTWWTANKGRMGKITNDLGAISAAAQRGNEAQLGVACGTLGRDTTAEENATPVNDPAVLAPLEAAMTDFSAASTSCVAGVQQNDSGAITTAAHDINKGNVKLGQATAAISAIG